MPGRTTRWTWLRPLAVACACTWLVLSPALAARDLFDDIYERGKGIDASLHTLTARFVETSTSPLLEQPLVASGTLAVERPSRVILRYDTPEARTLLIDDGRLTVDWPSRDLHRESNIGTAQRRVRTYFMGKSPDELRRHFTITAVAADDRPAYLVTLDPTRKQIRENLARLELWLDKDTLLLAAMRMHFAGGDTKEMTFSDVVVNPPLDAKTFTIGR
jgi:outer membrane lipoprotein-sorting protein